MFKKVLPIPNFFDPKNASKWEYRPNIMSLLGEAINFTDKYKISHSSNDKIKSHLILIDLQKDFCFPEGSLYVGGRSGTGAIDDNVRIAKFIYNNLQYITEITVTMDSHLPYQIFFCTFWYNKYGKMLEPNSVITIDQIRSGEVMPNPSIVKWLCKGDYGWLCKQVEFYCEELEKNGKYQLFLWPFHTMIGDDGHALAGIINEARMFHSFVRCSKNYAEIKGLNALTENYSVFSPEVLMCHDGSILDEKNKKLLRTINDDDMIIIMGQAGSHCVKSTIFDLLKEIMSQDPKLCEKVYIVEDCMSAVYIPDALGDNKPLDFTDGMKSAIDEFRTAGMNIVKSTEPIDSWPGIKI